MSKPLDELYFTWLCSQVGEDGRTKNPRTYWRMLRELFQKEFVWFIPNDDNRAEDGKDLRFEFIADVDLDIEPEPSWMNMGCSMLELLIGLSRRLSFLADGEPRDWFWELVENLNLEQYSDNVLVPDNRIGDILDEVIWRTYRRNGRGGLFPLRDRRCSDQRNLELWYQMNDYVLEKG